MPLLNRNTAVFVLVDLQVKLTRVMHESEALVDNIVRLAQGMTALMVPILWVEQNPAGLGPTVTPVANVMPGEPIPKLAFSACDEPQFVDALVPLRRTQVVLAGIESHVCVHQTATHLIERGYEVHVPADAVSSRTARNKTIGLERVRAAGGTVTSVECALFEMLGAAEGPVFKEILRIVK